MQDPTSHLASQGRERLGRRAFLRRGTLVLAAAGPAARLFAETKDDDAPPSAKIARRVRFGVLTDVHYADKVPAGTRHYRESIAKMQEATTRLAKAKPAFVVELGDLVDAAADAETELAYLARIHRELARCGCPRHYVLGNHCVHTLTKEQFLAGAGAERAHYSFDVRFDTAPDAGGVHFVVLDACYRADGVPYGARNFEWTDTEIPLAERRWLAEDLARTKLPTVAFVHQRLDTGRPYGVKSAPVVRKILEDSRKVLAVLQGHSHENEHHEIGGIHYCTLAAMVEGSGAESSAYGVVDLLADGTIRIDGFRRQKDWTWPREPAPPESEHREG